MHSDNFLCSFSLYTATNYVFSLAKKTQTLSIFIKRLENLLYIAVLSALQCKKGHKNIINPKLTYNPSVHIGKFIAHTS